MKKLNNRGGIDMAMLAFTIIVVSIGHWQYEKGNFGANGKMAVTPCDGTGINGDCWYLDESLKP